MASPDVVAPALLLPVPLLSLALSLHRSTPFKRTMFILLAVFAVVASGSALSHREPLRIIAKVFTLLLHTTLSGISIYALSPSCQTLSPPLRFLPSSLSLAAFLVACEFVSALIPASPLLLPATLALASRAILLTLAIASAILLRRRRATIATESNTEKGPPVNDSSGKALGRVSSPTQATWPFPGSLALQHQLQCDPSPPNKSTPTRLSPSVATCAHHASQDACKIDSQNFILLPLIIVAAQMFATLGAALGVAVSTPVGVAANQPLLHTLLLIHAACTLLWSLMATAAVKILPANARPDASEKQVGHPQRSRNGDSGKFSRDNTLSRTLKPSLSQRESDSILDFLSLRDPFASSPPLPPPLPPVGLGLDEVDVGWCGNKEIGVQYRFPAPRSIIKVGRRKRKNHRANGKKRLAHQDSSRTLLPVPETRGTDADAEKDRGLGDEAWLAQLLLQSLTEGGDISESPDMPTPVPTVQPPQAAHVQQNSRWSASTTVQSVVSASISNRSGVSTYTTCTSERIPQSRISMNTIASVLGSRKSLEARRKSATTASSSKG